MTVACFSPNACAGGIKAGRQAGLLVTGWRVCSSCVKATRLSYAALVVQIMVASTTAFLTAGRFGLAPVRCPNLALKCWED